MFLMLNQRFHCVEPDRGEKKKKSLKKPLVNDLEVRVSSVWS